MFRFCYYKQSTVDGTQPWLLLQFLLYHEPIGML